MSNRGVSRDTPSECTILSAFSDFFFLWGIRTEGGIGDNGAVEYAARLSPDEHTRLVMALPD